MSRFFCYGLKYSMWWFFANSIKFSFHVNDSPLFGCLSFVLWSIDNKKEYLYDCLINWFFLALYIFNWFNLALLLICMTFVDHYQILKLEGSQYPYLWTGNNDRLSAEKENGTDHEYGQKNGFPYWASKFRHWSFKSRLTNHYLPNDKDRVF